MRKLILAGAQALAIAPATALAAEKAPSAEDLAKASCKTQKAELGAKVFKQTHKAKSMSKAMKACMGVAEETAADELKNAAQECKAEREADADAFAETYGANKNGKNAYGKCVSTKAKAKEAAADAKDKQDAAEQKNAAKVCDAERDADADAFKERYGTNANKSNAFGKCVSKKARESETE